MAKIGEVIFEDIYPEKKFKYNSQNDFAFNQQIDDRPCGKQDAEMGLSIITPFYDNYSEYGEQQFYAMSFGGKTWTDQYVRVFEERFPYAKGKSGLTRAEKKQSSSTNFTRLLSLPNRTMDPPCTLSHPEGWLFGLVITSIRAT